mgnify:CR=1 FL=1
MGFPLSPFVDQLLLFDLNVLPKRIELPHLPSIILSPKYEANGCKLEYSLNPGPKLIPRDEF